jgi:hypothetical protein
MLWLLAAVLLFVWILGLALKVTTGLLHIALVVALVLFASGFFRGRRATGASRV